MSTTTNKETRHPSYTETEIRNSIISISPSKGSRFLLPYFHFLGGEIHLDPETKQEVFDLQFTLQTVRIEGVNLNSLARSFRQQKASAIRLADVESHRDEPIVTKIEIASRTEVD